MPSSPWQFSDDVETFAAHVWDLLRADPAGNTIPLTVIEGVRAGRRWSEEPMFFGWHGDPADAAVFMTPPYELHLRVPDDLVAGLATALSTAGAKVPGVTGEVGTVEAFVQEWTAADSHRAEVRMRTRLYSLDRLRHPDPLPPGRARTATSADLPLLVAWLDAFAVEAGTHAVGAEAAARDKLDRGGLWLWEGPTGEPVSLAGRNPPAAGVARVGPVYTPPEHRRRGYGAAVTAVCTEAALRTGASGVVLFTDLANPTSNSIYQQIGYRPVSDQSVVRFDDG